MKLQDLTYRITKIGGRAVSVAVCAMTGMMFMGSAAADTTTTLTSDGSPTPGVQSQGMAWSASQGHFWSTVDFNIQTPTIDALGIGTFNYPDTNGGDHSYTTINDNSINIYSGKNIAGKTLGNGALAAVYSANLLHTETWGWHSYHYNYSYFGSTSTLNLAGNNQINGIVGYNFTNWDCGNGYTCGSTDMLGTINLNGSSISFGDAVNADLTNINSGTNNTNINDYTFYGRLNSNLRFNQAASVLLNGGLGGDVLDVNNLGAAAGNLDFNGYNSIVTLGANQTIKGAVTTSGVNGVLVFQGAGNVMGEIGNDTNGSLKEIRMNGVGVVTLSNSATGTVTSANVDYVNYQAASTLAAADGLLMNVDTANTAQNKVAFNQHDGVLQIGNNASLTGIAGHDVVTSNGNGTLGTVTMVSGTQSVTGNIGSTGHAIKTLNIGGVASGIGIDASGSVASTTTMNGHVFAASTVLNNNSADSASSVLKMASGYDLNSTVSTADAGMGVLTLLGGTQKVTGSVGATGVRLHTVNSGADNPTSNVLNDATSNFLNDVSSNIINVAGGTSNFTNNVNATTTNIGTGVGNFNTNATGVTTSTINFTEAGTANLNTGLAGGISFSGNNAIVNVWDTKAITGNINTSTNNTGIVNFKGDGTLDGTTGASGFGISQLNINTSNEINQATGVQANGSIFAGSVNLQNNGALTLADNVNITGTAAGVASLTGATKVITTNVAGNGSLRFLGNSTVTGVVGAADAAIGSIQAGENSKSVVFNNMVFADTLSFSGNGKVELNGQAGLMADGLAGTSSTSTNAGLIGTVDFGDNGSPTAGTDNFGTLQIGNGVNLKTGASGINFKDANGATLTFAGNSTVTGVVGSSTNIDNNVFKTINAGVAGTTVTFKNDVYVSELENVPTTFHVINTGTVNFEGDLHSQLVFDSAGDGTVNVSAGKSLIVTLPIPAAVSINSGKGTINFLGSTTMTADLGVTGTNLNAVNFNTATDGVTQAINKNVFANTVTIGGAAGATTISKLNATGGYDYGYTLRMDVFSGRTTANISNVVGTDTIMLGGDLVIADAATAVNFGVAHVSTGNMTTNGGAMSFTVNTTDIGNGGNAVSASDGSGQVTASGALTMTGDEKVHVNYVGSLAQDGTYELIKSVSGTAANLGDETGTKVSDNSFSIDTSVAKSSNGSLILTADRTGGASGETYASNQNYIQKAGTMGDYSNNAGMMLGGIAAAGSQTGDMIEVIQKLELDSFGFGNTAANLATQVKRLAPVANASVTQSSLAASGLSLNAVGVRMAALRGDTKVASSDAVTGLSAGDAVASNGFWVKALGSSNSQDKQGAYDGYSSKVYGLTAGLDNRVNSDFVLGAALGLTKADINQADFRTGDTNRINNTQLMGYGTYNLTTELYLDGALSFARNAYTGVRATAVGRTASSEFNGNQLGARLGLGYGIDLGSKLKLTPMASVDYSRLTQDAYTETGAGAINLAVDAQSTNNTRLGLGARLSNEWTEGGSTYRPEVALNWSQNSKIISNDVNATFVGGGASFVTPGTTAVSRNSVNLGVAMTVLSSKTSSIQIRYDLDKSTGFTANTGSLLARWEY